MRHGRSSKHYDGSWLTWPAYKQFVAEYDEAGIRPDSDPTPELLALSARATRKVSSDMRRATESAERIARVPIEVSPLFRESAAPVPRWPVPMPLAGWDALMHFTWRLRQLVGLDDERGSLARAAKAADWLLDGRPGSECILVVTHGDFRSLLTRVLTARGLARTSGQLDYENWSIWSFIDRG